MIKSNATSIQRLPEALTKNGLAYRQYKRGKKAMIYAEINNTGKPHSYEVLMLKTYPAGERFGKMYPEREAFPGNEAFGKWAWAAHTLKKALEYFDALENDEKPGHTSSKEGPQSEDQTKVEQDPPETVITTYD